MHKSMLKHLSNLHKEIQIHIFDQFLLKKKQLKKIMQVQKLDMSKIDHGRNFLLLGARNTGKSVLLEDLLYQRRGNLEFVAAQTSTTSTKEMLCKHIPECLVSGDGFDADLLQRYIDQIR